MTDDLRQLVEDFGALFERLGIDRMSGRLLAWFVLCDPPRQSLGQLSESLGASRSAVSTSARLLVQWGVVERISVPGSREAWYELTARPWFHLLEAELDQVRAMRAFAQRAQALVARSRAPHRRRIDEMSEVFLAVEEEYAGLLERLRARYAKEG